MPSYKPLNQATQIAQGSDREYRNHLAWLQEVLNNLVKNENDKLLHFGTVFYTSGCQIYLEVQNRKNAFNTQTLTRIVELTKVIINGPIENGTALYRNQLNEYLKLSRRVSLFPWGNMLEGFMLSVIGTAIVVASGIVAAVSFGLLTPMSLLGVTFGLSCMSAGASILAGVVGACSLMKSGALLFDATSNNKLKTEMRRMEYAARNIHV